MGTSYWARGFYLLMFAASVAVLASCGGGGGGGGGAVAQIGGGGSSTDILAFTSPSMGTAVVPAFATVALTPVTFTPEDASDELLALELIVDHVGTGFNAGTGPAYEITITNADGDVCFHGWGAHPDNPTGTTTYRFTHFNNTETSHFVWKSSTSYTVSVSVTSGLVSSSVTVNSAKIRFVVIRNLVDDVSGGRFAF